MSERAVTVRSAKRASSFRVLCLGIVSDSLKAASRKRRCQIMLYLFVRTIVREALYGARTRFATAAGDFFWRSRVVGQSTGVWLQAAADRGAIYEPTVTTV